MNQRVNAITKYMQLSLAQNTYKDLLLNYPTGGQFHKAKKANTKYQVLINN